MADIGSHFFDMAEHVTGLKVSVGVQRLADFPSHPQAAERRRRKLSAASWASRAKAVDTQIVTEDFGATLFRMGTRARGAMTASQVSAGRKNGLVLEIYGTKGGVTWRQETPEELWLGHRDAPNQMLLKDPSLMSEAARGFADYPGGHAEGYPDTFKQLFRRFYASIADPDAPPDYPQMADGLRQMNILEAELESNRRHAWVDVAE